MRCPNCGKESVEGAVFCKFCGTKLVVPDAPQTPPVTRQMPETPAEPKTAETPTEPAAPQQEPAPGPQSQPSGSAQDRLAGMKETGAAKFAEAKVTGAAAFAKAKEIGAAGFAQAKEKGAEAKVAGAATFAKAKEAGASTYADFKEGGAAAAIDNVKKSNKLPLIIAAVVVVALIAIAAVVIPNLGKTTIDLKDYISVYTEGYDGYGYLYLDGNYDAFRQKLYVAAQSSEPIYVFEDSIESPVADQYEMLSNGDKITITWQMPEGLDKACKAKFKNETFTYKVSDLPKVEKVDIFEGCEFIVEGTAPYGTAYIESDYDLNFELDRSGDLSNGDKVTVTISAWDEEGDVQEYLARNYGVTAETLSKEYEVSGLPTYVTKISQIPDELMTQLDERVRTELTDYANEYWAEESNLGKMDLLGCYFFEGEDYGGSKLYLVYKVHYDNSKTGASEDYYFYGEYFDPTIESDGTCSVSDDFYTSLDNYRTYTFSDNYYVYGYGTLDELYNDIQEDNGYRLASDSTVQ